MSARKLIPCLLVMLASCRGSDGVTSPASEAASSSEADATAPETSAQEEFKEPDSPDMAEAQEMVITLEVICRESWGAKKPTGAYSKHKIKRITIHHTGVVFSDNSGVIKKLQGMQRYHQGKKKEFPDIAYHFIIDLLGNIFEGRPTWAKGDTKTDYDPKGHLLISLIGDFQKQEPTSEQLSSLVNTAAWAVDHFDVQPETIKGHRDHAHTTCPGKNLYSMILDGEITRRVEELLDDHKIEMKLLCGEEAEKRITAVTQSKDSGMEKK